MTSTLTVAVWAALAAASPQALVIPYQSVDVDEAEVARLGAALRVEVARHAWTTIDEAGTQKLLKSAAMCGEEPDCLATLGQRAGAQWVLAFSFGKVTRGLVASTILVEVATARRTSGTTEKMATIPVDFTNVARALVDPLFRDVPSPVVLTPGPPPEAPPLVAAEGPRTLRAVGTGVLVGGGLAAIGGVVLSVAAGTNFATLQNVPAEQRAGADGAQRGLNIAADVTVGVAIAAVATGVVLLIADAASSPAPAPAEEQQ